MVVGEFSGLMDFVDHCVLVEEIGLSNNYFQLGNKGK